MGGEYPPADYYSLTRMRQRIMAFETKLANIEKNDACHLDPVFMGMVGVVDEKGNKILDDGSVIKGKKIGKKIRKRLKLASNTSCCFIFGKKAAVSEPARSGGTNRESDTDETNGCDARQEASESLAQWLTDGR